jgi:hypothetical protein
MLLEWSILRILHVTMQNVGRRKIPYAASRTFHTPVSYLFADAFLEDKRLVPTASLAAAPLQKNPGHE